MVGVPFHPNVQSGLHHCLHQAGHSLAVGGGVKMPSFTGLPDFFRSAVDRLPEGVILYPDLRRNSIDFCL